MLQLLNKTNVNNSIGLFFYCCVNGQNTTNSGTRQDANSKSKRKGKVVPVLNAMKA
jgi:hypothetical protein